MPFVSIYDMRKEEESGKKGEGVKAQPINLILTGKIPVEFSEPKKLSVLGSF